MTSLDTIDICYGQFQDPAALFTTLSKHLQVTTHKIIMSFTVLDYVGVKQCPLLYGRTYTKGTNENTAPSTVSPPGRRRVRELGAPTNSEVTPAAA
jgi:hypothetical protein